jgi:DNA-binding transcriptional regulator GbsR (MarR family)
MVKDDSTGVRLETIYFHALVPREREKGKRRKYLYVSKDWGLLRHVRNLLEERSKNKYDILTCSTDTWGWEDILAETPHVISREYVEEPTGK